MNTSSAPEPATAPASGTATEAAAPDAQAAQSAPAFDSAEFLRSLPNLPGVYRMIAADGGTLYVGKARDLKKRVSSYFRKTGLAPRTQLMVSQIARMETTVVRTEAEALLLENNLIKSLEPRYNILFRDDKSYPYVCITGEATPQLRFHRGKLERGDRYFGPFPSAAAVREGLQLLQKVFRLRSCENAVFNNRSRPCMLYQIRRCSGPCVDMISPEDYAEDVKSAVMFMQGKTDDVIETLQKRMESLAADFKFELAALQRDKIFALQQIRAKQFVASANERDVDVIAAVAEQNLVAVNVVMVRGGLHVGDKTFFPRHADAAELPDLVAAFVTQHYLDRPVPPTLVVSEAIETATVAEVLGAQTNQKVAILTSPVGERRVWLTMAAQNARLAIQQRLAQKSTQEERLFRLQEALGLGERLQRIECFDISHTQGEAAVASCVVFDQLNMRSNEYRRFNVKPAKGGDDYAAMREALTRRCARIVSGEVPSPDLIVIDGGRGQVNVAVEVLSEAGLFDIALIGVAKGPERKVGHEEIIFPDRELPLRLPPDHPGFHLLHQIRDEAHRFAVQGHRARRAKARTTSQLEDIPGIGAKRRQALIQYFGGFRGVAAASVEELARVPGVSQSLAEQIYAALH